MKDLSSEEMEAVAKTAMAEDMEGYEIGRVIEGRDKNFHLLYAAGKQGVFIRLYSVIVRPQGKMTRESFDIPLDDLLELIATNKEVKNNDRCGNILSVLGASSARG